MTRLQGEQEGYVQSTGTSCRISRAKDVEAVGISNFYEGW
jgi:hypothetical protein